MSLGILIKTKHKGGGSAGGSLASNYLVACGIPNDSTTYFAGTAQEVTGAELWTAFNAFETELNTGGLVTDGRAYYPFLGISASTSKLNFFNSADTDAAHRIDWFGGMTHDRLGVTANGTTGYGNPHIDNDTHLNGDATWGWKSRVHSTQTGSMALGIQDYRGGAPRPSMYAAPANSSGNTYLGRNIQDDALSGFSSFTPDNTGIFTTTHNGTTGAANLYRDSVFKQLGTRTPLYTDRDIFIFAENFTTGGAPVSNPTGYSDFNFSAMYFYNKEFSTGEIADLEAAINTLDTALGR